MATDDVFAGREWDNDSKLDCNRAHWYDALAGRFICENLIGFADGPNPYRYTGNDPVNSRDPSGLTQETPSEASAQQLSEYSALIDRLQEVNQGIDDLGRRITRFEARLNDVRSQSFAGSRSQDRRRRALLMTTPVLKQANEARDELARLQLTLVLPVDTNRERLACSISM